MIVGIIDDARADLLVYEYVLARLPGVETRAFTSSSQALVWCASTEPALLLVDYRMPPPDGIEFVERYRAMHPESETPIIMITGDLDKGVRIRALEAGVSDFLNKPTDPVELQARARNLLALYEGRLRLRAQAASLKQDVARAVAELTAREEETIHQLMRAAEFRDDNTGQHIVRMGHYAEALAAGLGMDDEHRRRILLATPMHDIGKVAIPDSILLKPARLTPEEMQIMRGHAKAGYDILKVGRSKVLQLAAEIALGHHEKFDGTGYPSGIVGELIPLSARICAISDVFDALTTIRPYKRAWSVDDAFEEIHSLSGSAFDPKLTDLFVQMRDQIVDIKVRFSDHRAVAVS